MASPSTIHTFAHIVSDVDFLSSANHVVFSPGAVNNSSNYGKVIELDYTTQNIVFEATIDSSADVLWYHLPSNGTNDLVSLKILWRLMVTQPATHLLFCLGLFAFASQAAIRGNTTLAEPRFPLLSLINCWSARSYRRNLSQHHGWIPLWSSTRPYQATRPAPKRGACWSCRSSSFLHPLQ